MAVFNKYFTYIDEISKGGHNHQTAVFKCAPTNTAPTQASDTVWNTTVAPAPAALADGTAIAVDGQRADLIHGNRQPGPMRFGRRVVLLPHQW